MWVSHIYDDLPISFLSKYVLSSAGLVLAFLFLAPHVAHAAFTLSWGTVVYDEDSGDIIFDDRIYLPDGAETELPLGVTKKIGIGFTGTLYDVYGKLYQMNGSEREFVETLNQEEDFAWDVYGTYELDVFDAGAPVLSSRDWHRGFWQRLLGSIARADTGDYLGTIRFTIKPIQGPNQAPTLSFVPDSGGVLPEKGIPKTTEFVFRVVYTDLDNDAPQGAHLHVDGKEIALETETGTGDLHDDVFSNGEVLRAAYVFDDRGTYPFSFEAGDGTATTTLAGDVAISVGFSNVAFFPGVQASYLYKEGALTEDQVWTPNATLGTANDVENLALNPDGSSVDDIYTRENEIVRTAYESLLGGVPVYAGFDTYMDSLVSGGTIESWKPIVYDWRLDFDTILESGKQDGEKISYLNATSTPYIYQELKRLAENSESGKVSIIAHSNGGLLAKKLLKKLEDENDPLLSKIDLLVFVAVPQLGTPKTLFPLLHGTENPLGNFPTFLQDRVWRETVRHSPAAYNLLPSSEYLESGEVMIHFDSSLNNLTETIQKRDAEGYIGTTLSPVLDYRTHYGEDVRGFNELHDFLKGKEGRLGPAYDDVVHPSVLPTSFLASAENVHDEIDPWESPDTDHDGEPDIKVVQIVGVGLGTIAGVEFIAKKHLFGCTADSSTCSTDLYGVQAVPMYSSLGDETVTARSAAAMDVETYYVDLREYNDDGVDPDGVKIRKHFNIMALEPVTSILESLVYGAIVDEDEYISKVIPDTGDITVIEAHSPVDLAIQDSFGNISSLKKDTSSGVSYFEENVPNTTYFKVGSSTFMTVDSSSPHTVLLDGTGEGTFTLVIKKYTNDALKSKTTFSEVPVTGSLQGSVVLPILGKPITLSIDKDGNGIVDTTVQADGTTKTYQELFVNFRSIVSQSTMDKNIKVALTALSRLGEKAIQEKRILVGRVTIIAMELFIKQKTGKGIQSVDAIRLLAILKEIKTILK